MTLTSSSSPRRDESPLVRRKRDAAVANRECVQVQWRFLQHQNPAPPTFAGCRDRDRDRAPAAQLVADATRSSSSPHRLRDVSDLPVRDANARASPSKLFERFASPRADAELDAERKQQQQDASRRATQPQTQLHHEREPCRVLNDILGETQRKAMLSRIMNDMETLALQMHASQRSQQSPSSRPQRGYDSRPKTMRDDDNSKLVPLRQRRTSGLQMLRANLNLASSTAAAGAPDSRDAICLLPQRRMTALGTIAFNEDAAAQRHDSDDDDDDDNDDSDADDGSTTAHKQSAEAIAMAEIRKRRRREQRLRERNARTDTDDRAMYNHISWQKADGVRLALDVPQSLQTTDATVHNARPPASPSPSSAANMDEQQSFSSLVTHRRRPFVARTDSMTSVRMAQAAGPTETDAAVSPVSPPKSPPAVSPRDVRKLKAPYGAWYVPRSQWWPRHVNEQQALAERFPIEAHALAQMCGQQHDRHCHHAPHARDHKPAVVMGIGSPVPVSPPGAALNGSVGSK